MSDVRFVLTVRRGAFVKRRTDGSVYYVSPLPCPFDYGEVPGTMAADGDALDVVVWGALPADAVGPGDDYALALQGAVDFYDDGVVDTKLIVGDTAPGASGRVAILAFFRLLALAKSLRGMVRQRGGGRSRVVGWLDATAATERLRSAQASANIDGSRS